MPASSESLRSDRRATRRCSRMNSPRSCMRVSRSFIPRSTVRAALVEERLDARLAALVAAYELGLEGVDALVQRPPAARHIRFELAQTSGEGADVVVGGAGELRQPTGVGDSIHFSDKVGVIRGRHRRRQPAESGTYDLAAQDLGELLDEGGDVGGLTPLGP